MPIPLDHVTLEVWHQNTPPSDTPDVELERRVEDITFSDRAQEVLDEASLVLRAPELTASGDFDYDLRLGDRLRVVAELETGTVGYGEAGYGEGTYGSAPAAIDWMGRVLPTSRDRHSVPVDSQLSVEATDFVGDVLSDRWITQSYVQEDVGAIIRDIVRLKADEVDASQVPDLGVSTDGFYQNSNCWDTIVALAARADAIIRQRGDQLLIDPIEALPAPIALTGEDYGVPWTTDTEENVKNVVRVDSGVSRKAETAQETATGWTRVTDTQRLTHRLRARKSDVHSIDIYLRKVSSGDDLRVRLQADEGGAPVAIEDADSDIAGARWSPDNLPGEGWQAFFLEDHTLPDRDPWLIIEASGEEGHDIGINDTGVPAYRSYYSHPLNFEVVSTASIREYGQRELRIERANLETLSATRDEAQSQLARRAWPMKTIEFPATSPDAHALKPGDRIAVDEPREDAVGEFIVMETAHTLDAGADMLWTDITATWRQGVLAPPTTL